MDLPSATSTANKVRAVAIYHVLLSRTSTDDDVDTFLSHLQQKITEPTAIQHTPETGLPPMPWIINVKYISRDIIRSNHTSILPRVLRVRGWDGDDACLVLE